MRPAILFLVFSLTGRAIAAEPTPLDHLAVFLTGSFSNAAQARGDQNFRSTVLHGTAIWPDRTDGPWLYVEQALADAPEHPFRQAIYQLRSRPDQKLEVLIFDVPDPIAATGAWRTPARLQALNPEQLVRRTGCSLVLELQAGGTFKGGTEGTGCASSLRGASFSTIQMTVSNVEIVTWERGYNSAGAQVRGSIHGGYVFKRAD